MAITTNVNQQAPNQLDLEANAAKIQGQAEAMGGGIPIDTDITDMANQLVQQQQQTKLKDVGIKQQQAGLEQQAQIKRQQMKTQSLNIKEKFKQDTDELLQKFSQNRDLLDLDKFSSEQNQLLFNLRMQNTQYIDKLKIEGTKQRLQDANAFKEAMMNAIFEDEIGFLKNDLSFRQLMQSTELAARGAMASDQRAWQNYLAEIDLEYAMKVALSESDARNNAMKFEAISQISQAVIKQGFNTYQQSQREPAKAQPSTKNSGGWYSGSLEV